MKVMKIKYFALLCHLVCENKTSIIIEMPGCHSHFLVFIQRRFNVGILTWKRIVHVVENPQHVEVMGQILCAVLVIRISAFKRDVMRNVGRVILVIGGTPVCRQFLRGWWRGGWKVEPRAFVGLPPECSRSCGAVRPQGDGKWRSGGG